MTPESELSSDELSRVLRATERRHREPSPGCLDDQQIAAYVDGRVGPAGQAEIEAHLADCARCLGLVGLLVREDAADAEAEIPQAALDRAAEFARPTAPTSPRHLPRWAAVAAMLALIPALVHLQRTAQGPSAGETEAPRTTRSAPAAVESLQVLKPTAGSVVEPRELRVHWSTVPGSSYYDVRIVTDTGELVVEERVAGTEWRPGATVELQPGVEYFVRVDAYPTAGKSIGSAHVPFVVKD